MLGVSQESKKQLFTLINELNTQINHSDYLGAIVGYSVIDGLIDFRTLIGTSENYKHPMPAGATTQYKFDEVRAVYIGLEKSISNLQNATHGDIIDKYVSTLNSRVAPLLKIKGQLDAHQSVLFKNIVANLDPDNAIMETMRKKGLMLVELVKSKKEFRKTINCLTEDYRSITQVFCVKKAYEYK